MDLGKMLGDLVERVTGNDNNQNDNVQNAGYDQGTDPTMDPEMSGGQDILPASMDPMGDPADDPQYGGMQNTGMDDGSILPASMDPLGDPADDPNSGNFGEGDILPASMDPLGDPADQR